MRPGPAPVLLVVALSLAAPALAGDEAPLPDSLIGRRTAPLLLLSRPDVRADLGLSGEQSDSAARAIRSFYVHAHALLGKGNGPEIIRERRAVDDEAFAWIESRLSPELRVRLAQLDLQWEGPSALATRRVVAEALGLSADQVATLRNAVTLRNAGRDKGRPDADSDLLRSALACLSETQRETWKGLLGRRLPFAEVAAGPAKGLER